MKRSEVTNRPMKDTVLAALEPEQTEYRLLDGDGLYFRVKPDGSKSWQFRYKNAAGKWAWNGLGGYPSMKGAAARKKAAAVRADLEWY